MQQIVSIKNKIQYLEHHDWNKYMKIKFPYIEQKVYPKFTLKFANLKKEIYPDMRYENPSLPKLKDGRLEELVVSAFLIKELYDGRFLFELYTPIYLSFGYGHICLTRFILLDKAVDDEKIDNSFDKILDYNYNYSLTDYKYEVGDEHINHYIEQYYPKLFHACTHYRVSFEKYENEINLIKFQGYTDIEKIKEILEKNNGDIVKTIITLEDEKREKEKEIYICL
jgi:hypothetical protein